MYVRPEERAVAILCVYGKIYISIYINSGPAYDGLLLLLLISPLYLKKEKNIVQPTSVFAEISNF